jgi:hypothetical protein
MKMKWKTSFAHFHSLIVVPWAMEYMLMNQTASEVAKFLTALQAHLVARNCRARNQNKDYDFILWMILLQRANLSIQQALAALLAIGSIAGKERSARSQKLTTVSVLRDQSKIQSHSITWVFFCLHFFLCKQWSKPQHSRENEQFFPNRSLCVKNVVGLQTINKHGPIIRRNMQKNSGGVPSANWNSAMKKNICCISHMICILQMQVFTVHLLRIFLPQHHLQITTVNQSRLMKYRRFHMRKRKH